MALGGGTFVTQNKVLPGTYINFVSAANASANIADRGIAAMPLELDWGIDGEVFTVTQEDFQKDSMKWFGYSYIDAKLKGLRDLFLNIKEAHIYKLNDGVKSSNTYADAKYKGTRGNDIVTKVVVNVDDNAKMDVSTIVDGLLIDLQTVLPNTDNLIVNDFVDWKTNVILVATAGLALTGGSNTALTGTEYQTALDALESVSFNTLGCLSVDDTVKSLFVAYTKRLRDDLGIKFQTVLYNKVADYEGIINVKNAVDITGGDLVSSLVYFTTGISAGVAVNKDNTNKVYSGEFSALTPYTQAQLEDGIKAGEFMYHKVGSDVRVLDDINSLTTFTPEKNEDFASNQIIRILDQIATDIAVLFNTRYLGQISNNKTGRISLWNDIVKHHQDLQTLGAIEDFVADDVTVDEGDSKKAVVVNDVITPVNAMKQLYMTVVVQ